MLDEAEKSTLLVKIGDVGGGSCSLFSRIFGKNLLLVTDIATWQEKPDKRPPTPVALRAPELVRGVYLWSLGCLVRRPKPASSM